MIMYPNHIEKVLHKIFRKSPYFKNQNYKFPYPYDVITHRRNPVFGFRSSNKIIRTISSWIWDWPSLSLFFNTLVLSGTVFYYFLYNMFFIIPAIVFKIKTNSYTYEGPNSLYGGRWIQQFFFGELRGRALLKFSYFYNINQVKNIIFKNKGVFNDIAAIKIKPFVWNSTILDVKRYSLKKKVLHAYNMLYNNYVFTFSDLIVLYMITKSYSALIKLFFNTKVNYFIKQVNWFFYNTILRKNSVKVKINNYLNYCFIGLRSFWNAIRYWSVGIFLFFFIFFYFLQLKDVPFNKSFFGYFIVSMYFYWLMSGFVFFIKKYQYSKFTSVIQRFWKRTFIIFWMIEGSLIVVFIFLTLNASEEPVYMYDQIKIYKTHLFSWRWFLVKIIPAVLLILLGYYLQMTVRWGVFCRQSTIILGITLLIVYLLWTEFYQFFHVVSYYGNFFWTYDSDEFLWSIELDDRRNRICNNYVTICLITKFWHIVFMFIFWIFFVLRVNELKRLRYPLISANVQNFFILYILAWVYMYPWFKFLFRKQLDNPYYWFNLSFRRTGLRIFIIDIKLNLFTIYNFFLTNSHLNSYTYVPFYYWYNSGSLISLASFRKSSIKDLIITTLNTTIC